MSGALIAVAYGVLIWQAGWWGVAAIAAHVAIMLGAVRLHGRRGKRPPS